MSKYIIELDDDIKYLIINGRADNRCYTLVRPVAELELLNSDYINEHFGDLQDTAYQKGFEDGKAQSENGCEGCMWEGNPYDACEQCSNAYKNLWTAMQKTDEIKVGDEVRNKSHDTTWTAVVTKRKGDVIYLMGRGGAVSDYHLSNFEKTGRHFDIDKILEEMKG